MILQVTGGADQKGVAGRELPAPLEVSVLDSRGAGIRGVKLEFIVQSGGGSVTPGSSLSDSNGKAHASWTLGPQVKDAQSVVAIVQAESKSLDAFFEATALPGSPALVRAAGVVSMGGAGQTLATPLLALVTDSLGNPAPGAMPAWSASDGTLSITKAAAGADGVAEALWTLGTSPTQTASASLGTGMASFFSGTAYSRSGIGVQIIGQTGSRVYGVNLALGAIPVGDFVSSEDSGKTWLDEGFNSASLNVPLHSFLQRIAIGGEIFLASATGHVWRSAGQPLAFLDITPPSLPPGTTGRPDCIATDGERLFYGNYNATVSAGGHVYRSGDSGDHWVEVLTIPDARHVHAIGVDPQLTSRVLVTVGDAGYPGRGLWESDNHGDPGTWRQVEADLYGIDLTFIPGTPGVPSKALIEADGRVMSFIYSYDGSAGTQIAIPTPGAEWAGTVRGIRLTRSGDLFFVSTSEGGAVGTRDALWLARGPDYSSLVLLEDLTGVKTAWSYWGSYLVGPDILSDRFRLTLPP